MFLTRAPISEIPPHINTMIYNLTVTDLNAVEPGVDLVVLLHEVVERPNLKKRILFNNMNLGVEKCSFKGKHKKVKDNMNFGVEHCP